MDEQIITLITTGCINILMLLLLLFLIFQNVLISEKKVKYYVIAVTLAIVTITAENLTVIFEHLGEAFKTADIISNIIALGISGFIPLILVQMTEERVKSILHFLYIPPFLNVICLLISVKTGWVFYISGQNIYVKGPLHFLYVIVYLYGMLLLMIVNHMNSSRYQKRERLFYFLLYCVMITGTVLQILLPYTHAASQVIAVLIVIFYLFQRELQFKYDGLTELFNRQEFERAMQHLNNEKDVVIILFDVDKFKTINDTYGHITGDFCLKRSAELIKEVFSTAGYSYRIGGDEFCVLAKNIGEGELQLLLKSMHERIRQEKEIGNITATISYGYSFYKKDFHHDIMAAFQEADQKMYKLKQESNDFT